MTKRSFSQPDEVRTFDLGAVDVVALGEVTLGRMTLQPGWKWSKSVKPLVKTKSCLAPHLQYLLSGRLHVAMDDGTEAEFGPGDLGVIPPGHDAWVVGNEPVVAIDITGMANYARPAG
jgi:ethanolamine utilization protein EutQ (cupin superfamily)